MFGSLGRSLARGSLSFVSQAALAAGVGERYGLQKTTVAVQNCRSVTKANMVHNSYLPTMEVDAQRYTVRADGVLLTCEPAKQLSLAQRYFLF
jgi:urease subunit alpha